METGVNKDVGMAPHIRNFGKDGERQALYSNTSKPKMWMRNKAIG
jgi:hypothetical protein